MLKVSGSESFRNDLACRQAGCTEVTSKGLPARTSLFAQIFEQNRQGRIGVGASTGYCAKHAKKSEKERALAVALKLHSLKGDAFAKLAALPENAERIAAADKVKSEREAARVAARLEAAAEAAAEAEATAVAEAEAEASAEAASTQAEARKPRARSRKAVS